MPKTYYKTEENFNKTKGILLITPPWTAVVSKPRIAPINPFQKIPELCRGNRNCSTALADRPDELAPLQPLQSERHANPIVPQKLDEVALAAPKAEYLSAVRIAAKPLPNRSCQAVHPAAHVRHTTRYPDLCRGWKCHHRVTAKLLSKRATASISKSAGIVTRQSSPGSMVITSGCGDDTGGTTSEDGPVLIGTRRINGAGQPRSPSFCR